MPLIPDSPQRMGIYETVSSKDILSAMEEQRKTSRKRTFKGGSIIFGLAPAVDCVIRNLSVSGALVEVESPVGIPDDFALLIKPETIRRNCRVEWRSANRIGVQFI